MAYQDAPVLYDQGDDNLQRKHGRQMQEWRSQAYDEAMRTLQSSIEWPRIPEYIRFLEGNWWDRRRPRYLSRFSDNRLEYARYSKLAMLSDIKPIITVSARYKEYDQQAKIAANVIKYEWFRNDLDLSLVSVVDASNLFGNGFWKIGAAMPGFMKFTACGPDMVLPIQPGPDIQSSTAVLYRSYKPIQYFQKLWPERSNGLDQEAVDTQAYAGDKFSKPYQVSDYTWQNMSPQMRRQVGLRSSGETSYGEDKFPVIELQEYWLDDQNLNLSNKEVTIKDPYLSLEDHNYHYKVKPGGRLYPRKRLIVFAGNRLMYDGPSPYWHGLFPFAMLRLHPVLWSFWGLSGYRNLIEINRAINEIGAGVQDLVQRALKPQMVTKEGGVPKAAWDTFFSNMPGGKLRLGPTSNVATDIRYMEPPQLPPYVFQMMAQYLLPEFDRMSGFLDPNRLTNKKQAPGGEAIEQMRESQAPHIRLEGRYLETFLRDAGNIAISNIFQFYNARQRMMIMGGDGLTWEDFDYNPKSMIPDSFQPQEDFHRMFAMEIAQGSLLGSAGSKDREKALAISMAKMDLISRQELYRRLEIPNGAAIIKEMVEEAKAGIHGGGQGRTPRQTRGQRQGEVI